MDFALSEEHLLLRETIRKLMAMHAPPERMRKMEREQAYPYEVYEAWAAAGLLRLPFPEMYGGSGATILDTAIVAEELSRYSIDLAMSFGSSVFCGLNLLRKGSEEQKAEWLPKLLSGEIKCSIAISEPDAGSDVGAMRTTARRIGDEWIINGQKLWATGAGMRGNVLNVYAKTDTTRDHRNGMSLFLVPNHRPGVECRKLEMLGRRCTGTYEIFLNDVRVPADHLVGGENRGWDVLLSGLQVERVISAANSCGGAQAVIDLAVQYAKERRQFGRPIGSFQAIAHMLADMQTSVEAARTIVWRAAWLLDTKTDALREISMAKLLASECYADVANKGMQVLGAHGYSMECDMQRHFRDSRAATIAGGTSQMQRNLIAHLMGL